jgi:hypothetical protein
MTMYAAVPETLPSPSIFHSVSLGYEGDGWEISGGLAFGAFLIPIAAHAAAMPLTCAAERRSHRGSVLDSVFDLGQRGREGMA